MNRHAKASSAGPTMRQASRLRRIFRGAFASRAASSDSKGSGAPLTARRSKLLLGAGAGLLLTLALGVTLATAVAPVVTVKDATNVQYTTADVEGTVKPEGQLTEWRFQYITDAAFQDNIANTLPGFEGATTGPEGATEADETLERQLTDLSPATTYHLRLFAQNGDGPSEEVAASTFETKVVTAPVVTVQDASAVTGSTAHFAGTVNPGNANAAFDSSCAFDYATQAQFDADGFASASQIDCDVNPVSATEPPEPIDVQANPTNLLANTTYHLRLRAQNLGGTTAPEATSTFTTLAVAPAILHTSVTEVTTSQAVLNAEINPGGDPTTYRFQYMTEAAYEAAGDTFTGATQTPVTSLALGAADNAVHQASASLAGLVPDTSYRYRVLATNSVATTEGDKTFLGDERQHVLHTYAPSGEEADTCPNAALRAEQHSTRLPDCRAYEQATPVDKNGGEVHLNATRTQAAVNGDAIKFSSLQGFGDVRGMGVGTDYIAKRGTSGWATHAITPVLEPGDLGDVLIGNFESRYLGYLAPDLSRGVFVAKSPIGATPENAGPNLYLRDDLLSPGVGHYTLLGDSVEPQAYEARNQPAPADATEDFSHVAFESNRNLTQDAVDAESGAGLDGSEPKLYESVRDETDSPTTRLVGQVPSSGPECIGAACVPSISKAGKGALSGFYTNNTISRDGSRVLFTTPPFAPLPGESANSSGKLYLRDDQGTFSTADDTSAQINAPELVSPEEAQPAAFWDASSGVDSGGDPVPLRVFFTSAEKLTGNDSNTSTDLYMWSEQADGDGHHLTRISVDQELSDGDNPSGISGVIGASADGSYVYFTSIQNQLVPGGPTGQTGGPNGGERIFVWHDGALREVAAINGGLERINVLGADGSTKFSRVTPDGTHLVMMTEGTDELLSLYGKPEYDHGTECPSFASSECFEIYVYDATANGGAGGMQCASCNPSGAEGTVDADLWHTYLESGGARGIGRINRSISDDGHYVFFNSAEELVPQDTNGVSDAYEYDTTTEEVHLLSSGTSPEASYFLEASADGSNAFFTTRERLVGWDNDGGRDLYVARIGGGFPEPTPVPAPCSGDQCRGGVAGTPIAPGAATATFNGPGDQVAKRQKKKRRQHKKKRRHHSRSHSTRSHG